MPIRQPEYKFEEKKAFASQMSTLILNSQLKAQMANSQRAFSAEMSIIVLFGLQSAVIPALSRPLHNELYLCFFFAHSSQSDVVDWRNDPVGQLRVVSHSSSQDDRQIAGAIHHSSQSTTSVCNNQK